MSLYGASVEYGLHSLLHLVEPPDRVKPSSRDLAEFQGISPTYVAKLFTQLEKAGIVRALEGAGGGYALALPANEITVLAVVDALEGGKPLFQCRDIRERCILNSDSPPQTYRGVCEIHAVMLEGERRMREALAETTLADIATAVTKKLPKRRTAEGKEWFAERGQTRRAKTPRR